MSYLTERKKPISDYLNRETATTTELPFLAATTVAFYTKGSFIAMQR
jgi:hypothetical protein